VQKPKKRVSPFSKKRFEFFNPSERQRQRVGGDKNAGGRSSNQKERHVGATAGGKNGGALGTLNNRKRLRVGKS